MAKMFKKEPKNTKKAFIEDISKEKKILAKMSQQGKKKNIVKNAEAKIRSKARKSLKSKN